MNGPKWTQIAKPDPKGHRFFILTDHPEGPIFAADDSGNTPDQTEDGHIVVVRDASIKATVDGYFIIPMNKLKAGDAVSSTTSMLASFTEAAWLCATYHMKIEHKGKVYQLLEVPA